MYTKIPLQNGDTLNDFHLNYIQDGILDIERDSKKFRQSLITILRAKGIACSDDESYDSLSKKVNYLNTAYIPNDDSGEYAGEIDIRKTVKSGQMQILCSDVANGLVEFYAWTRDGGQYSIDWGDGTVDIYDNGAKASHQYIKGVGGVPYKENNSQWVATITCNGNQFYRFRQLNNSDMIWFVSKDIYFEYMYCMFGGGDTDAHAPKNLKYVDFIGGSLGCDRDSNCAYTFRSCENLIRVSGSINLAKASNAYQFFLYCRRLKEVPSVLNLSSVSNAGYLFGYCESLETLPNLVSTSNISNAAHMFKGCNKLKEAPTLSLMNCVNAYEMFAYCALLEDVRKISGTGNLTTAHGMFRECPRLKYVPDTLDLGSSTNCAFLFNGCSSLIDAPATLYLNSAIDIYYLFRMCTALRTPPSTLVAPNAINAYDLFNGCTSLRSAPRIIDLPNAQQLYSMFTNCKAIKVATETMRFPEALNIDSMFSGCDLLETPPRELIAPKAINSQSLFLNCISLLKTPDVINLEASQKVGNMFNGCRVLSNVAIDTLNLPNALYINALFATCRNITIAPNIIAPIALEVQDMFSGCERLVQAKPYTLPRAQNMNSFYSNCKALEIVPKLEAPLATSWRATYAYMSLARIITSMPGPACQDMYYLMWETSSKLSSIGNFIDLTNVANATNWIWTVDPMQVEGPITFKGCKTNLSMVNCRKLSSIRFQNMDPMCGNLNFSSCALEANEINLLFGDLVRTNVPATITVTGNPGAATCDTKIATEKGWTVNK